MRIKILIVFGTRPEAIKLAPLINEMQLFLDKIDPIVCVTAQHREMLDSVLQTFDLKPDVDLNLMTRNQNLSGMTASTLVAVGEVLERLKPDIVVVHGDTTTAMASTLAAFYAGIKVAHVEAGLRTYNNLAPFPEEINRRIISEIAEIHFAPTEQNFKNLLSEKIAENKITITGNTVIDALHYTLDKIDRDNKKLDEIRFELMSIIKFDYEKNNFILITGHRRENFRVGFDEICGGIKELAIRFPELIFVYPVHLNPNVQNIVFDVLGGIKNIRLVPPLGYELFISLLRSCFLVLTDSGGIQEEASSLGKPVLVMRDETERIEGILSGSVKLVGANRAQIVSSVSNLLLSNLDYESMAKSKNPFGDGRAASRIVNKLLELQKT